MENKTINDNQQPYWNPINWNKANRVVNNLSRRIFVAKIQGKYRTLRKLQRLFIKSYSNCLLAVQKVYKVSNQKTIYDVNFNYYFLSEDSRKVACSLKKISMRKWKPTSVKLFTSYSKKNNSYLRLKTLKDRALMYLISSVLKPEWEAVFEKNNFKLPPNRSSHQAIKDLIHLGSKRKNCKWLICLCLKKDFEKNNYNFILKSLHSFPYKGMIAKFLKFRGFDFQSGLSILKSDDHYDINRSLCHLLLRFILINIPVFNIEARTNEKNKTITSHWDLIRNNNNMLFACHSRQEAHTIIQKFNCYSKKIRIIRLRSNFDIFGFNMTYSNAKNDKLKFLIKPSPDSIKLIQYKIKKIWNKVRGYPIQYVLKKFNPLIRKWTKYYKPFVSKEVFSHLDYWMYHRQYRWAKQMHPRKSNKWLKKKYWHRSILKQKTKSLFGYQNLITKQNLNMFKFSDV